MSQAYIYSTSKPSFISIEVKMICNLGTGKYTELVIAHNLLTSISSASLYRPVNDAGERVALSSFWEYRRSHEFLGPSCFCASLSSDESAYTEVSIFLAKFGASAGRYVAACAEGLCRYWGMFILAGVYVGVIITFIGIHPVSIKDLHNQRGLLLRRYLQRGKIPHTLARSFGAYSCCRDCLARHTCTTCAEVPIRGSAQAMGYRRSHWVNCSRPGHVKPSVIQYVNYIYVIAAADLISYVIIQME
jgi:hypothetical protein